MTDEENKDLQKKAEDIVPEGGFMILVVPQEPNGFSVWAYDDTEVTKDSISEMHVFYRGTVELLCEEPKTVMELGRDMIVSEVEAASSPEGDNVLPFKPKGTVH